MSSGAFPLAGRRVLVTRAAGQAGKLSEGLRALGAEPVEVPVLEIREPVDREPLDRAMRELVSFDWLIFTSTNAVDAVTRALERAPAERTRPESVGFASLKVAVVGAATAEAAAKAGFRVEIVPREQHSEGLVLAIGSRMDGQRVLYPRAAAARDVIRKALAERNVDVTEVEAYRTAIPEGAQAIFHAAYATGFAAAVFASSSSVRNLAQIAGMAGAGFPPAGVKAVSIGPVTSATLHGFGWEPAAEAKVSDVPGLIAAVVDVLGIRESETGE